MTKFTVYSSRNSRDSNEMYQVMRQENLASRYVGSLAKIKELVENLGMDFDFLEATPNEVLLEAQARKSFGWVWFSGNFYHEARQTAQIEALKEKVLALKAYSNHILQQININFVTYKLTEKITIAKIPEPYRGFLDFGWFNQGAQNRALTAIERSLTHIDAVMLGIARGYTISLHQAISGQENLDEFMKFADVNMPIKGKNALEIATDTGNPVIITNILKKCTPTTLNTEFSTGKFFIKYAIEQVSQGNEALLALAAPKADLNINLGGSSGVLGRLFTIAHTPLHYALGIKDLKAAAILIENGARINIPSSETHLTAYELIGSNFNDNDEILATITSQDHTNYITKTQQNLVLQYGIMFSDFFIKPAINCANEQVKHDSKIISHYNYRGKPIYKDATYSECYLDKLDTKHFIYSLRTPAITLALQNVIPPIYTVGTIMACDIAVSEQPVTDALYAGAAILAYAGISYALAPINVPTIVVGIALPIALPLIELAVNLVGEGYHQLTPSGEL